MFNQIILVGNIGKDPEIKATNTGKQVANFSVATSSGSGDKKVTEWHRCVAWEKSAEIVDKYMKKGTLVFVQGQIRTRKWQDKAGADRWSTEVVIGGYGTSIRTLKGGTENGNSGSSTADDGDIPFDAGDDL